MTTKTLRETALRYFSYDPETGILIRKVSQRGYKSKIGMEAGWWNKGGYRQVSIDNKKYMVHRIVWLMVYGHLPEQIDHVNSDRGDNRLTNLRECNNRQNSAHRLPGEGYSSKYKGVGWYKPYRCWRAKICLQGKTVHLGYFFDEGEAAKSYNSAAIEHFGKFALLNNIGE